jgi:hypothetical protein
MKVGRRACRALVLTKAGPMVGRRVPSEPLQGMECRDELRLGHVAARRDGRALPLIISGLRGPTRPALPNDNRFGCQI